MNEAFEVLPYRLTFLAVEPVTFPEGQPGNILRGAFGTIFRRLVCVPQCREPRSCDRRDTCPYARVFEPRAILVGPSGLADRPRPFVFRAHHLDGLTVPPGAAFHFDLHLFEVKQPLLVHFIESLKRLAEEGVGPTRGRARLVRAELLGPSGSPTQHVYGEATGLLLAPATPLVLDLSPDREPVSAVLIRFLTPTELKRQGTLAVPPEFPALLARIRDRLSALSSLYGAGPLDIDFKAIGQRAEQVTIVHSRIVHSSVKRRSSRTGQIHPLGGFTGEAEYKGALAEFMPYLRAARWTGVGRQTVWGHGVIEVAACSRPDPNHDPLGL